MALSSGQAEKRIKTGHADPELQKFLDSTNADYEKFHLAFEEQFWGTKMALSGDFSTAKLTETKMAMEAMLADPSRLAKTREWIASGNGDDSQRKTLAIFDRTHGCYIMESAEAAELRKQATELEDSLGAKRNTMKLGYKNSAGDFVDQSSVGLRNKMRTDPDESVRRACFEDGLRAIGPFILANGFPEVVRMRNRMAKKLGYVDYYDYKVTQAEGFNKVRLFEILDTLERGSRPLMESALKQLAADKGDKALLPWNTSFMTAGDVTAKLDPYFPFDRAVEQWGRCFAALGIEYRGAEMVLDLLDRKGKYSNGFCHWPQPAWVKGDGAWQASRAHFTSLADPTAIGSGHTALTTLMHEAGHAAHFANIVQTSPLFSQERAPTSVAYAENQSMFLDSLVGDAAWRARYCRNACGEPLPWHIHEEDLCCTHPLAVMALRGMLAVPYFERALYELAEEQVTSDRIAELADEIEKRIQGNMAARPLLSVPHIISDEASCYYHGYVLAEMSVHQTREHFLKKYGRIVDNPAVGAALTERYWRSGNSEMFLDLVNNLTGAPLTGDAWIDSLKKPLARLLAEEKKDYETALAEVKAAVPAYGTGDIDLKMRVRIVDGDSVIADSGVEGSFVKACDKFGVYVRQRFSKM